MPYAVVNDITATASLNQLAQALSKDAAAVNGDLLADALAGNDISEQSEADQKAVNRSVALLGEILDNANAETHGYVSARYPDLNPEDAPSILRVYTTDICRYRIFGGEVESPVYLRYKKALEWLKAVAEGKVNLDVPVAAESGGAGARTVGPERVFTPAVWERF